MKVPSEGIYHFMKEWREYRRESQKSLFGLQQTTLPVNNFGHVNDSSYLCAPKLGFMFPVSAPSLVISAVVAIFYLANMMFFAVNRYQQETEKTAVETAYRSITAMPVAQYAIIACFDNAVAKKHTASANPSQDICRQWFAGCMAAVPDGFQLIFYSPPFIPAKQGVLHLLFFRPPPVIG